MPLIVTSILENHSFLVDTVVIVHSNQLPRTRYGDKQRGKAKTAFMEKTLYGDIKVRLSVKYLVTNNSMLGPFFMSAASTTSTNRLLYLNGANRSSELTMM